MISRTIEVRVADFCPEKCPQIEPFREATLYANDVPFGEVQWACLNIESCKRIFEAMKKEKK